MFQIKICGLTNLADADVAVAAGADALGLNFYSGSSRRVEIDVAQEIAAAVGRRALKVGVFVNAPAAEILQIFDAVGLDAIQLHGDERPDMLRALAPRPVIKAFRLGPGGLAQVRAWLEPCVAMSLFPRMLLIDAFVDGSYGGTGRTTDWSTAAAYARTAGVPPLVLAGGLTPENVAEAIRAVGPAAVDTAGGVEQSAGRKDPAKMAAFAAAARSAFG